MAEVRNKRVVLRNYVAGFPKESDMKLVEGRIKLKVPEGSYKVLVKNLYLSCDPVMRVMMINIEAIDVYHHYTPDAVSYQTFFQFFSTFSHCVLLLKNVIIKNYKFMYYVNAFKMLPAFQSSWTSFSSFNFELSYRVTFLKLN